ncbi:MAG: aminoglycoside phosphotransferase family protein [Paracoccaceae bacterium]|nr:aminoglycoside phosphotransferase family protein [Paracoccaceae bacterium]
MREGKPAGPGHRLKDRLAARAAENGLLRVDAEWQVLTGGRTSPVWRVRSGPEDRVCRFRVADHRNPLFPCLPDAERRCLEAVSGCELGPPFLGSLSAEGGELFVLEYSSGTSWTCAGSERPVADVCEVARLLGRLHRFSPLPDLPVRPCGETALRRQVRRILSLCSGEDSSRLSRLEPGTAPGSGTEDCGPRSLVHGDVVPGNIIRSPNGLLLIDWQCPGIGDPVDDIACFLSPAMQMTNGGRPLGSALCDSFLEAYPCAATVARYRSLRPLLQWRMAVYCLWRVVCGRPGYPEYRQAMEAEIQAMTG